MSGIAFADILLQLSSRQDNVVDAKPFQCSFMLVAEVSADRCGTQQSFPLRPRARESARAVQKNVVLEVPYSRLN